MAIDQKKIYRYNHYHAAARKKNLGLEPHPYRRGPRHLRQLAESDLGLDLPEVQRLGALFRKILTQARQQHTLETLLAQPADAPLEAGRESSRRQAPRKAPRDSVFSSAAALLRFCLAYYRPPLADGRQPRQADLQRDYGLTQPQVSQWLRLGRRTLRTALQQLAAAPDEEAHALVAKVQARHPALGAASRADNKGATPIPLASAAAEAADGPD